jgi:DNA ligase 1
MKTFPILYQKTNTGAIQQWQIAVFDATIQTIHGQVGGKLQTTTDTIKEGKSAGKKNATTPEQQAEKEASARWTKQKKKGYVESIADAEAGKVDETLIKGGIEPMLAPSEVYPHFKKDLTLPCYEQPKLDGNRCIAQLVEGKCTLWTRTRKPIGSVPHIIAAIEAKFAGQTLTFDGELYNHDYRDNFEDLMSLIRPPAPVEGHEVVQYWIYDLPSCQENFGARHHALFALLHDVEQGSPLVMVATTVCAKESDIWDAHERNVSNEFEGTMLRNDGPYEMGRRSRHLQKLKTWKEGEWPIIGFTDGRGKDIATVAAFICAIHEGYDAEAIEEICANIVAGGDRAKNELRGFKARLKASYARRRELFTKADFFSKMLTVKYQNLTANGKPRFPNGKSIRDYE